MRVILVLIFILSTTVTRSQNISGIINLYSPVIDIQCNTITVQDIGLFSVNDKVMIIQMKGATVDVSNTSSSGDIINLNNAGNYEIATVISSNANNVVIANPLLQSYNLNQKVQLIKVPEYVNATVIAPLQALAWDGVKGGVIALICSGTLTLNSNIDASGTGYNGGAITPDFFNCGDFNYINTGGFKGESIVDVSITTPTGRGKWAAGGGGGNPGNSGGGGGALASSGGLGGNEYSGCGTSGIQGIGGASIPFSNSKMFMGSGGGGGYGDNGSAITPGSKGGGIVFIKANTLDGNNNTILAEGLNQSIQATDESAGGGGSGGSVYLDVISFPTPISITTKGGDGGDTYNNIFTFDCHGTGGGGSGGYLAFSQSSLPATVTYLANGGTAGLVLNPSSSCYNTTFGATNGGNGTTVFNLSVPLSNLPLPIVSLGNDTSVCLSNSFTITAPLGYASYVWNTTETTQSININTADTFILQVSDANFCVATDSIIVTQIVPSLSNPLNDTIVCENEFVSFIASPNFISYLWSTGAITQQLLTNLTDTFTVLMIDNSGCSVTDTVVLNNFITQNLNLGSDTSICPGTIINIDAGNNFNTYSWSNGEITSSILAQAPNLFSVTVTDSNNCTTSDQIQVDNTSPAILQLSDLEVCADDPKIIDLPFGYLSYLWNDGSTVSSIEITQSGIYSYQVIDSSFCIISDTFITTYNCPSKLIFPNAFSPNQDGINDKFNPIYYNITDYNIKIFNRWGELVFESSNPNISWNGTFKNQLCELGVYVYVALYKDNNNLTQPQKIIKGNVMLMR